MSQIKRGNFLLYALPAPQKQQTPAQGAALARLGCAQRRWRAGSAAALVIASGLLKAPVVTPSAPTAPQQKGLGEAQIRSRARQHQGNEQQSSINRSRESAP